ncbi:MAG: FIST signal transduction protein [Flavobacteriales bacterium]
MITTEQIQWSSSKGWDMLNPETTIPHANWVMAFAGVDRANADFLYPFLKARYPNADILIASSAGEIIGRQVFDDTITVTAAAFEHTKLKAVDIDVLQYGDPRACGKAIADQLRGDGLKHVFVISDGISVNGDRLVDALNDELTASILITGGLAGDAGRFTQTFVGLNGEAKTNRIVAVGFYGDQLKVSFGTEGGWDLFGPIRKVTRAEDNVLYELDQQNALEIYKKYLGDRASELPGSALLFPLCILDEKGNAQLVRTILSIDEAAGAMRFAGNIPEGATVQFMMANFDRVVDGAMLAAEHAALDKNPELVVMISCVGRKIILGPRVEEEVEAVCDYFGKAPAYHGFYSNGEIAPAPFKVGCSLHNQTMTITTYRES